MEHEEIATLETALNDLKVIYRWIYFEYMMSDKNPNIDTLKSIQHKYLEGVFSKLHDKYEDHVEAARVEISSIKTLS
jgi:hypothetical protein